MKKFMIFGAAIVLVLGIILMSGVRAADAFDVIFYDEDGTTVLKRIPLTQVPASPDLHYIDWKQLNNVPDYNNGGIGSDKTGATKVILSWKQRGGADTRYVLSYNAARANQFSNATRVAPLVFLSGNDVHLVPLKTYPMADFEEIRTGTIVVDGHTDTVGSMVNSTTRQPVEANDLSVDTNATGGQRTTQGLYSRLKAGGMNGVIHGCYTSRQALDSVRGAGDRANSTILSLINATQWSAERNPDLVQIVYDSAGFRSAHAAGRIPIMQAIESAYSLTEENAEELLEQYYDLGIRLLSFTHNPNSNLAAGNQMSYTGGTAAQGGNFTIRGVGMTPLGKKVLEKMDKLGMAFDISHTDDQTVRDALSISKNPIAGSHSGSRGEYDHVRNLWDPEIVAMAQGGGVIFQNYYGDYMSDPRGVYEVVNQMEYIIDLLEKPVAQGGAGFAKGKGIEYIGIGTDYDGGTNTADVNDASFFYRTTRELLARDYTAADIRKIYHENAFRFFDEVQGNATIKHDGTAVITSPMVSGKALVRGVNYARIDTRKPEFSANVTGATSGRVIVDGIVYPSTLSGGKLSASLENTPLQEIAHVVTFEATDSNGKVTRNTNIFFIEVGVPVIHKIEFRYPDGKALAKAAYVDDGKSLVAMGMTMPPSELPNGRLVNNWSHFWSGQVYEKSDAFFSTTAITESYRFLAKDIVNVLDSLAQNDVKVEVRQDSNGKVIVKITDSRLKTGDLIFIDFIPQDETKLAVKCGLMFFTDKSITIPDVYNDQFEDGVKYVAIYKYAENESIFGSSQFDDTRGKVFEYKEDKHSDDDRFGCNAGYPLALAVVSLLLWNRRK